MDVLEVVIFVFLALVNIPGAMVSILTIAIMQRVPGLELANRTLSTVRPGHSVNIRENKFRAAVRASLIVFCLTLPLSFISIQHAFVVAILFGAAWSFSPVSYIYVNHIRLLQTFNGNGLIQVHLLKIEQSFDKITYHELLEILSSPPLNVSLILLESPMFYRGIGKERDFNLIALLAKKRGWRMSVRQSKIRAVHIFAIVIMFFTIGKSKNANITRWMRLEFERL